MLDYSSKEFVRSFVYSNLKEDRRIQKREVILGREHIKLGTACATTMVCDCWKVYDSSVERFKYVYLAGVARQHPQDISVKYADGVAIAHENAMVNPVFTMIYDNPVQFEFVEFMMENYISQLPVQFVKTRQEIEYQDFINKCEEEIYEVDYPHGK